MSVGIKRTNEYAQELGNLYAAMPKAVLAAVAVSFSLRSGATFSEVAADISGEWDVLWQQGIVSQKPPTRVLQPSPTEDREP